MKFIYFERERERESTGRGRNKWRERGRREGDRRSEAGPSADSRELNAGLQLTNIETLT